MTVVWFREAALSAIRDEASRIEPVETGGILMGYWAGEAEAVVADVVGPGPAAVHAADQFAPDYDFQDAEVARVYLGSGGSLTYLGDWHSHGLAPPYLSRKDRRTLYGIATDPASRAPRALMAVVGSFPDWRLSVWEFRKWPLPRLTHLWSARPCIVRLYA